MAAALLRRDLATRDVDAHVSSAGLLTEDRPPSDEVIELMGKINLDVTGERSRLLTDRIVSSSDLVLAMAREHVRAAVLLDPPSFGRTFTLKEIVRRGREVGSRSGDESFDAWLARVGEGRQPADCMGSSPLDDIVDPIGRRFGVFKQVATEIEELTADLVRLAWPWR